jgi:DNA-directed RNA polymerase sigma subunit (sigma70/sigma32)
MNKKPIPDLSRTEIEELIDLWIFSERDRAVLKRRILDGIVFEKLGEEFSLSTQSVKKIVYKSLDKIYKHI